MKKSIIYPCVGSCSRSVWHLPVMSLRAMPSSCLDRPVTLINRYFTDPQISHIKIEAGIFGLESYEVLLTDRTEIDFDSNGNWTDVVARKLLCPKL